MLEVLTDMQRARVLAALLAAHPDLVAEADELAPAHPFLDQIAPAAAGVCEAAVDDGLALLDGL